jgi:hypothetical protein
MIKNTKALTQRLHFPKAEFIVNTASEDGVPQENVIFPPLQGPRRRLSLMSVGPLWLRFAPAVCRLINPAETECPLDLSTSAWVEATGWTGFVRRSPLQSQSNTGAYFRAY